MTPPGSQHITELVNQALAMALGQRLPDGVGLIMPTDRGSQETGT